MTTPEDSKPEGVTIQEETPAIPSWRQKPNTFFNRLKETLIFLANMERDDTAKYYSELSDECMKNFKPSFWEALKKGKQLEKIPLDQRMNLDFYETEEEKQMITCLNNLQKERKSIFLEDYKVKDSCFDQCEADYPRKTGPVNAFWRHNCKKKCETNFASLVKPKIREMHAKKEQEAKQEKENITL